MFCGWESRNYVYFPEKMCLAEDVIRLLLDRKMFVTYPEKEVL